MPRGAIAAGHRLTAEAAAECLRAGGNAVDAMIAAAFTACVAEPVLASLGGGGFMLSAMVGGKPQLADFFTQTPIRQKRSDEVDFYAVDIDFGTTTQEFHIGLGSVATPGMVSGLFEAHRRYGSLPMPVIVEHAVVQARQGVAVTPFQAYLFALIEPIFLAHSSTRQLFESRRKPGQVVMTGEQVAMERFADLLEVLAIEGDDLFYRGEVADEIEMHLSDGGQIDKVDLAQYRTQIRQPLSFSYRSHQIVTNPPPAAGGALIAFALQLLADTDLSMMRPGNLEHLSVLCEIMELTNAARIESTPSDQHCPDVNHLLSD